MSAKKRILLVDDDEHLLMVLGDYLAFEGFAVTTAPSGERALKCIEHEAPDLIVLDISMPGMGGMGFLRRIGDASGRPRYPVLVFTARSALEGFFDSVEVDGFVAKPASEAELVGRIRDVLMRRERGLPPPPPAPKRVLLAESQPHMANFVSAVFGAAGYEVEVAGDGEEALRRAAARPPALILCKEILPKMNGSALAPVAATMANLRNVPIVIYDDTRPEADPFGFRPSRPHNVARYLNTADATEMLKAVREVLG